MRSPVSACDPGEELGAVGGRRQASVATARMPRTGRRASRAAQACERRDGAVHGASDEPAVAAQPLAEPDDAAEAVDHAEAGIGRGADQQPAIIGAEVDRREGAARPGGPVLLCRCWPAVRRTLPCSRPFHSIMWANRGAASRACCLEVSQKPGGGCDRPGPHAIHPRSRDGPLGG